MSAEWKNPDYTYSYALGKEGERGFRRYGGQAVMTVCGEYREVLENKDTCDGLFVDEHDRPAVLHMETGETKLWLRYVDPYAPDVDTTLVIDLDDPDSDVDLRRTGCEEGLWTTPLGVLPESQPITEWLDERVSETRVIVPLPTTLERLREISDRMRNWTPVRFENPE